MIFWLFENKIHSTDKANSCEVCGFYGTELTLMGLKWSETHFFASDTLERTWFVNTAAAASLPVKHQLLLPWLLQQGTECSAEVIEERVSFFFELFSAGLVRVSKDGHCLRS